MQFSKDTVSILKSLSAVNTNILFKPGSKLSSISPQKNVMVDIDVAEKFPKEFGIYDLSEFLGVLSLFDDADVTFTDKYATISEGDSSIQYYAADPSILVVPQKSLTFPATDVEFNLSAATLSKVMKTAGVLRSSDVSIVGDGKAVSIVVADLKSATANSFKISVGKSSVKFTANLKTDNLKLIPGDYEVSLSAKKISRFKHSSIPATFFVALESSSRFD